VFADRDKNDSRIDNEATENKKNTIQVNNNNNNKNNKNLEKDKKK
jgi:hypothetical protein